MLIVFIIPFLSKIGITLQKGCFIGFDYGTKRIGLAVGQTITCTASPLGVVKNNNHQIDWAQIQQFCDQWKPEGLIVGLPLNMDDTDNPITVLARQFAQKLEKKMGLPVTCVDERLSSREVHYELEALGKKFKGKNDALAAVLILERFLKR